MIVAVIRLMNKSTLVPILCELLDSLLKRYGYRYLKTKESYQKKAGSVRLWLMPNVTYWASSDYCMISPRMCVHVDAVEDVLAKHASRPVDRHFGHISILSDNLEDAKFWSIRSLEEFQQQSSEIEQVIENVCVPILDGWSDHYSVAVAAIRNEHDSFQSELHRLSVLFGYLCAYPGTELKTDIIKSIDLDSIASSRYQLDPYYRGILASIADAVPEIREFVPGA